MFCFLESIRKHYEKNLTIINKYFKKDICSNMKDWCWMEMWSNQMNLASYISRLEYKEVIFSPVKKYRDLDSSQFYEIMEYFEVMYKSISIVQSHNSSEAHGIVKNMTYLGINTFEMGRIINETFKEIKIFESNTSINISHFKNKFHEMLLEEADYIEHVRHLPKSNCNIRLHTYNTILSFI